MKITVLSVITVVLVCIAACAGLFYSSGGEPRVVESIHGETVELFGDGVYANNSTFTATIRKGSDLAMLFVSVGLLAVTLKRNTGHKMKLAHGGLLASVLYYAATTAFETVYNQLFLLYLCMFSAAFFAFVFTVIDLRGTIRPPGKNGKHTKTAVFTMIAGCTVLIWLMDVIPGILTGTPPGFISIYTTSPTIIIDIGLILPSCALSGVMLMQKKPMGYILPPIMLAFLSVIAVTVVGQTAVQMAYGINIPIHQLIGYVGSFAVFGFIAAVVNIRFMLKRWPKC